MEVDCLSNYFSERLGTVKGLPFLLLRKLITKQKILLGKIKLFKFY